MNFKVFGKAAKDEVIETLVSGGDIEAVSDKIIEFAELVSVGCEDVLKDNVITRIADEENVLSKVIGSGLEAGESLKKAALSDLEEFIKLLNRVGTYNYIKSQGTDKYFSLYTQSIKAMCAEKDSEKLLELLCRHFRQIGTGIFAKYTAFLQEADGISGIESPDPTTFDTLIGLEHIKEVLIDNTEALMRGERANNVLLFGDRGTGKSSCVKALLNMYCERGLKVIELPKNCIGKIPELFKKLAKMPHKFILYLDDLSFEKHEPEYRSLKVAMDGQLGATPQNVLIYATSNRRHLIKENWKDREGGDVHASDNMQEMLSLSERFGISLVFSAPNQKEYLDIVAKLLKRKGIKITPQIEQKAIIWQMNYGGRTPRCAAQFVAAYNERN